MNKHKLLLFTFIILTFIRCARFEPAAPSDDQTLDGPIPGLSHEELAQFARGDVAFNDEIFTEATGLGPIFVATSCGGCHPIDGKGHPFTTLTRFGQSDSTGNKFKHLGGPQLQHRALPGYQPEQLPPDAPSAKFTPPANTGLGFLAYVTDADLLAMSDPNDLNGDGISGRVHWVSIPEYAKTQQNAMVQNGKYIGRFGKKASVHSLLQQTANAYNQDMGVNSILEPYDTWSGKLTEPEVSLNTINDVVFYLETLKAPVQRNANNPEVIQGKNTFVQLGCESCHRSTMQSGDAPIQALRFKTFHPYTDLLLHDMGDELREPYTEGSAGTSEWRTPPLWGLGLSKQSQGGKYYLLHDGRAGSIEEAILFHGGEAQKSKTSYQNLSSSEKMTLITFLESL